MMSEIIGIAKWNTMAVILLYWGPLGNFSNSAEMMQGVEEFNINMTFSLWVLDHNLRDDPGLLISFTLIRKYKR